MVVTQNYIIITEALNFAQTTDEMSKRKTSLWKMSNRLCKISIKCFMDEPGVDEVKKRRIA